MIFDTSSLTEYVSGMAGNVPGICFKVTDVAGVVYHDIDFGAPDIIPSGSPIFNLDLSSFGLPFIIGNTFNIIGQIKDQDGTIYATLPLIKTVCKAPKLNESGYVPGSFQLLSNCVDNVLTVKENTLLTYDNKRPLSIVKSGVLNYPTGSSISPVTFTNTPFSNNVIVTGENSINCTTVATYDLGDDFYVSVTYITKQKFPVTCQDFLGDIYCCLSQLQKTYSENCDNAIGLKAKQQTFDVLLPIVNGIIGQFSGKDVSSQVAFIKKQLGCDCGTSSLGQNEMIPVNPAVTSIVLTGGGGTSIADPVVNGDTKTFAILSSSYQIAKGDTGDLAWKITVDTSVPNLIKYKLTFNYTIMAGYILTAIANNPSLITQLNTLINATGANLTGLNGKCIIDLTKNDYVLSQNGLTGATGIVSVLINGTTYTAPGGLFASDNTGISNWLNSLALGSFMVIYSSGVLTITSSANVNVVSSLTVTTPGLTIPFQSSNATLVQVLQAMIDFMCTINASKVALAANLQLLYFDYNAQIQSWNFTPLNSQQEFDQGVQDSIATLINRMNTLTAVNCAVMKTIFVDNVQGVFAGVLARVYGLDQNGNCVSFTDRQIALGFLAAVNQYTDIKAQFCAVDCTVPGTCPAIAGASLNQVGGTSIGLYGLTWGSTPNASQTVSVRYKLHTDANYIVATNSLTIFPNGSISGTSPYQIIGLTAGQTYDVWVQNNCGGSGFIQQFTVSSSTVYSGTYLLNSFLYLVCGSSPITLYSGSPFGPSVFMFADAGLTTPVTGYSYIVDNATGNIWTIDPSTGQVLLNTGTNCNTGTAGIYRLANDTTSICSSSPVTLYTNGPFAVAGILYTDPALSTSQLGFAYVAYQANGHIYNLGSGDGVIGADTALNCNTNYTLSSAFNFSIDSVSGTGVPTLPPTGLNNNEFGFQSGMSGTYNVAVSGSVVITTKLVAYVNNIQVDCIAVSGAGTYPLNITATSSDNVRIAVLSSAC